MKTTLLAASLMLTALFETRPKPQPITLEVHMMCFDDKTQLWNRCRIIQPQSKISAIEAAGENWKHVDFLVSYPGRGRITKDGKILLEPGTTQADFIKEILAAEESDKKKIEEYRPTCPKFDVRPIRLR